LQQEQEQQQQQQQQQSLKLPETPDAQWINFHTFVLYTWRSKFISELFFALHEI
jgi:hypothetical protein